MVIVHFIFFILKLVTEVINVQMNQKIQTGGEQIKFKVNLPENSREHWLHVLLDGLHVDACLHICNSAYFPAQGGLTLPTLPDNLLLRLLPLLCAHLSRLGNTFFARTWIRGSFNVIYDFVYLDVPDFL